MKYEYQEAIGYKIVGMKVYDKNSGLYRIFDKSYGLSFNDKNIPQAFLNFIFDGKNFRFDILEEIMGKLEAIEKWFSEESHYRFYGHSILIVYESEGGCNRCHEERNEDAKPKKQFSGVEVKLIDFAHWYESPRENRRRDESSIFGLKSLLRSFSWLQSFVKSRAYETAPEYKATSSPLKFER